MLCYFKMSSEEKIFLPDWMETVFLEAIFYQLFKSSLSVTLILRCIGVVTSIVIFPFGIIVLIFYFCGHKCTGTENTLGRRGREGGESGSEGREGGREGG